MLKADADIKDIDKGMRIKYDCSTCGKQFVSKNNLERHQSSHDNTQENVCEHCNKQFVSENRLRIHKENHCKKAGDISKFYRSDVTVWKCIKCNQVFATPASANRHAESCTEIVDTNVCMDVKAEENSNLAQDCSALTMLKEEIKTLSCVAPEIVIEESANAKPDLVAPNVEKVLTELLLQCEYCNRTYSDRNLLIAHQKKHTTDVNYECVTCKETFDSYTSAAKHWMTKCSDEANLFYLPKMTYCEYCDRTFKSHEILYTHKIKKKHYTPKLHILKNDDLSDKTVNPESKEALTKFIQNTLTVIDVVNNGDKETESNKENENSNKIQEDKVVAVKKENSKLEAAPQNLENQEPEKKKRGRKRKWPKQVTKAKRFSLVLDEGYKYQCERCILVFDNVSDLETHREKEHASNFACEECGQV